ncbi:MAG: hypothetical protein Q9204_001988, partial [Flavoplaca sp. TL-2023a]
MDKSNTGKLNERFEIVELLRGQHIEIPNFHHLFEQWPEATSVQLDALRTDVDSTLDKLFPPGQRRSKLKAADPALFGSMWWPYASLERLCIATYLSIWLFAWDDESDSPEFSELSLNLPEAQAFRATTVERVRTCLALDHNTPYQRIDATLTEAQNSIIEQFVPVGHALVKHYTLDQRHALMQEIDWYVLDVRLPEHVMLNPAMRRLWDETNIIISTQAQNQVDSLIPLLYIAHNQNLQAAVDDAINILRTAVARFDFAAKSLLEEIASDRVVTADLVRFIDSCRYACTANLNW